ncbi:MAG TPA: agglutinin biogenesis protein MshP [Telluria sp.]|nr:agglutinin biogenesis protein MshP [Telluria sp.]
MTTTRRFPIRRLGRSTGVGLITAIFLLVVLAGLGVAMVTVFTAQQNSSTLDVQGARAYQAARAGIEWGLYQQFRNGSCSSATFALPMNGTPSGFTVAVTCRLVHDPSLGPTTALDRFVITAIACNLQPAGGSCQVPINSVDYVQRRIEVTI